MELSKYQEEAKRTMPDLGNDKINLCHMILGISSEKEEFYKAIVLDDKVNIQEEIIDQFWYLANYCTLRNYSLEQLNNERFNFYQESWEEQCPIGEVCFSKLNDYIKKYVAYNKSIDTEKEKNALQGILFELNNEIEFHDVSLEQGLENNINKLKIRFPDKFTEELAINRNTDKERVELEKIK